MSVIHICYLPRQIKIHTQTHSNETLFIPNFHVKVYIHFSTKATNAGNVVQMLMFYIFKEHKVNKLVLTQTVELYW